jgi:site-specific DNA recombinase
LERLSLLRPQAGVESMSERIVRCAIYTRKSTEEGLEQEFNTLQAQREAAEAYILSQKQNGWHTLAQRYEDGGFSGASLERPALQQLLADIHARKVDCVVVYKVDRLSRSLLDFARLLSVFEKRGVSFVSVTQEFNTSTSMGRLTLNILLSFAQFEREIISERTRDKLSAARRKGKWTGGSPVLGYDIQGGRLAVNSAEAERVREIFTICAGCTTLRAAQTEVDAHGLVSKAWISKSGKQHGERRFTQSTLGALLRNVLYIGEVSHKGVAYPGEQTAIVDRTLWARVQEHLKLETRRGARHGKVEALLSGLLYCAQCGERMRTTYSSRQGRRHLYYECRTRKGDAKCQQKPVASVDLEPSLLEQLEPTLGFPCDGILLQRSLERVTYDSRTREVRVTLMDRSRFAYTVVLANRSGVRRTLDEQALGRVPRVSRLMALALKFQGLLSDGTVRNHTELAQIGHVSRTRVCQILMLTNLAPGIQEALLFLPKTVTGPDRITESRLRGIASLVDWDAQIQRFRSELALLRVSDGTHAGRRAQMSALSGLISTDCAR